MNQSNVTYTCNIMQYNIPYYDITRHNTTAICRARLLRGDPGGPDRGLESLRGTNNHNNNNTINNDAKQS